MSDYWQLNVLQHARLLCPALSPGVCSNSCPLNWWCYLIISSCAVHFSFYLQSFPASGSFPMSQLFASGGQSIGASASVLAMNSQGWFPLGFTIVLSLKPQNWTVRWVSLSSLCGWTWDSEYINKLPQMSMRCFFPTFLFWNNYKLMGSCEVSALGFHLSLTQFLPLLHWI